MERATSYGFENQVSLKEGVIDAIEWFLENKDIVDKRYNILNK
jgi:nucleoside-diphosphate-sugar epimerase